MRIVSKKWVDDNTKLIQYVDSFYAVWNGCSYEESLKRINEILPSVKYFSRYIETFEFFDINGNLVKTIISL